MKILTYKNFTFLFHIKYLLMLEICKIFSFCAFLCLFRAANGQVYGGTELTQQQRDSEVPYIVSIEISRSTYGRKADPFLCVGTILNEYWVLTAGHCFDPVHFEESKKHLIRNKLEIVAGNLQVFGSKNSKKFESYFWIVHPKYHEVQNYDLIYDIALVQTTKKFNFGRRVSPGTLPSSNTKVTKGQDCKVYGWGKLFDGNTHSEKLRHGTLKYDGLATGLEHVINIVDGSATLGSPNANLTTK